LEQDKDLKPGFDVAFKWFEYHARQRIEMFRFFLVVAAGAISIAGYGWKVRDGLIVSVCGFVLLGTCALFHKLDQRCAHLVRCGETSIKRFWDWMGYERDANPAFLSEVRIKGQIRFRIAFGVTFLATAAMAMALIAAGVYMLIGK
jgi:hypothetical protein